MGLHRRVLQLILHELTFRTNEGVPRQSGKGGCCLARLADRVGWPTMGRRQSTFPLTRRLPCGPLSFWHVG